MPWLHLLHHGYRCSRNMLAPLPVEERDGNMPRERRTPPARKGPSASLGSRSKPASFHSGGLSLYSLTFSLKIGAAPAFSHPVGASLGLNSLRSLCSHIFCRAKIFDGKAFPGREKVLLRHAHASHNARAGSADNLPRRAPLHSALHREHAGYHGRLRRASAKHTCAQRDRYPAAARSG